MHGYPQDENLESYVYVYECSNSYNHVRKSIQYRYHENIEPIDTIKIGFKDFMNYYTINQK